MLILDVYCHKNNTKDPIQRCCAVCFSAKHISMLPSLLSSFPAVLG